jgi:predicted TIM-barrel fold metal-dependent hydrolase
VLFDGHVHAVGRLAKLDSVLRSLDHGALGRSVSRAVIMAGPSQRLSARRIPVLYHRTIGTCRVGKHLSWRVLGELYGSQRYRPDNAHVAQLVAAAPERLVGFAFIDPGHVDAIADARRWVEHAGFAGLKLHGWLHRVPLSSEPVQLLSEYAGQRRLPMLVHPGLGARSAHALAALVRDHPHTKFIVPHLEEHAVDLAARLDNVFLDTSGLCVTLRHFELALHRAGATKLIFGSDSPRETGGDLVYSLRLLDRARLSSADVERVCWRTLTEMLSDVRTSELSAA